MMDFPTLRIQIEGLGQKFQAAIADHADELQAKVEEVFVKYVDDGSLERDIEKQVREAMPRIIKNAVESWQVTRHIEDAVKNALAKPDEQVTQ